jgi:hypothetical protein
MATTDQPQNSEPPSTPPQPWEPPQLSYLGNVEDILQASRGKISSLGADPGDTQQVKTRGSG